MIEELWEKHPGAVIGGIIVILLIVFFIRVDNNAVLADVQSYENKTDYEIYNATIADHTSNTVVLEMLAKPRNFYITLDIATSDELIIGGNALVVKYKNDNLDGKYQYKTTVALSKKGNIADIALKFLHVGTSNLYEGKITKKSYNKP